MIFIDPRIHSLWTYTMAIGFLELKISFQDIDRPYDTQLVDLHNADWIQWVLQTLQ